MVICRNVLDYYHLIIFALFLLFLNQYSLFCSRREATFLQPQVYLPSYAQFTYILTSQTTVKQLYIKNLTQFVHITAFVQIEPVWLH